jgi:hypothetical protein
VKLLVLAVGLLGAGLYFASDAGYLVGRADDGPLQIGQGNIGLVVEPGDTPLFPDVARVRGPAVELESARPALISPGLELLGPLRGGAGYDKQCTGCSGRWPPDRSRKLDRIADDDPVISSVRARTSGLYYLHGIRYRYRRGLRRYDVRDDTTICLTVSRPEAEESQCAMDDRMDDFEGLAEIGGPSDYGDASIDDEGFDGSQAVFTYREGGELSFTITISNLSDEDRRVERLGLGRADPTYRDLLDPLPVKPFTIPANGHRSVRVRARYGRCRGHQEGLSYEYGTIEAGDDDVELSLPISVRVRRTCPGR